MSQAYGGFPVDPDIIALTPHIPWTKPLIDSETPLRTGTFRHVIVPSCAHSHYLYVPTKPSRALPGTPDRDGLIVPTCAILSGHPCAGPHPRTSTYPTVTTTRHHANQLDLAGTRRSMIARLVQHHRCPQFRSGCMLQVSSCPYPRPDQIRGGTVHHTGRNLRSKVLRPHFFRSLSPLDHLTAGWKFVSLRPHPCSVLWRLTPRM